MVSKAVVFAVTVTLGLLAPGPTVLQTDWLDGWTPRPAELLQVNRTSRDVCRVPARELRFEMLSVEAEAAPFSSGPALCLAVYHPSGRDPWGNAARP